MTVRYTNRAGTKVGHNDPLILNGKVRAQRIKDTLGITGWSFFRVPIDGMVWHLDVDSAHPGGEEAPKG